MLQKILIANRGEIAIRIIRACKELGIRTVAVYSTEDRDSLHVKLADEAVCIGHARSSESYLNINNILSTAVNLKCDGVHPGYGFLSENAEFAHRLEENGIVFIGPSSEIIETMGDKIRAITLMREKGIKTVPGSDGEIKDYGELSEVADRIGYPVLIKASGGGGGRGMRKVYSDENLRREFESARKEALNAFGNGTMYVEKLIENPKHIEVQILADNYGNTVALGERDCSIQRKNQKMIEETPCSILDEKTRSLILKEAVKASTACSYKGAGTVEFVYSEGEFYFIEMNTRIQVEHPVTELSTGIDLVKEQIKIASGMKLKIRQEDINIKKHSIECRINAENPLKDFAPQAGKVDFLNIPGGLNVRFDTYLYNGCRISPYYDSMVGKLIVAEDTRTEAIKKMRTALEELVIEGVDTNIFLQYAVLFNEDFTEGKYDTSFIEKNLESLLNLVKAGD